MKALIHSIWAAAMIVCSAGAQAQTADPAGPVILTISTADGAEMNFDLDMIDGLDQVVTVTETPWHDGAQEFSGPLVSDLLAPLGLSVGEVRFIAVNDYAASMPWADIEAYPVILATRHNGETMSVRDKGPLFVIYPFDTYPELRNEVYFARSVWQVKAIQVIP